MSKSIIIKFAMAIALALVVFLLIKGSSLFRTIAPSEFRNLKLEGKVIGKIINKELYEKTHTVIFSDSSKYTLPTNLDNSIEIGDSIYKKHQTYEIIIFKNAKLNDRIIFVLPYAD